MEADGSLQKRILEAEAQGEVVDVAFSGNELEDGILLDGLVKALSQGQLLRKGG